VRIARSSERERARLFGPVPGRPDESTRIRSTGPPTQAGAPAPGAWPTTYEWGATRYSSPSPSGGENRFRPGVQGAGAAALEHPVPLELRFIGNRRYELLEVIGIGGMGQVYRARDARTDAEVAIKILDARRQQTFGGRSDEEMRERFKREAEIGKSLQIPGVARMLVGPIEEPHGRLAIVQELMPGPTLLAAVLESGPFPPRRAARIAQRLAHSLAQIHASGVLRMDLKPSNIIVGADDLPGIVDFGIARSEHFDAEITEAGAIVGTPAYMAPELLDGAEPSATADVYALGVVICFMLTGRTPWSEPFARARFEEPDLSELPGSPQLRQVVREASRVDPTERIPLAADLEAVLLGTPELEQPAPEES
jgi:serine/threonine-protein kinase